MLRNFSDTVGLTESDNHNIVIKRNLNETVNATESFNRLRDQIRNINEIVGAVDTTTKIRGIWKNISDIVGLSSIENKQSLHYLNIHWKMDQEHYTLKMELVTMSKKHL
jgi:hypothetical protein